jgi:hypothetical protein
VSLLRRIKRAVRSVDEYVGLVERVLGDGDLSPDDLRELHALAAKLDMTVEERDRAHCRAIERMMRRSMADGYLDPQETETLGRAMEALRLTPAHVDPATSQALYRALVLQEAAAGRLPVLDPAQVPLVLAPGEEAHVATPCRIDQERVVGRTGGGGYSGLSFRIARGVRYHIGGSRGRSYPVKAQVTVSRGILVLTSRRATYLGSTRGFNKPWAKVTAVEPYADAVTFYFADRQNATTLLYEDPGAAPLVEAVTAWILR